MSERFSDYEARKTHSSVSAKTPGVINKEDNSASFKLDKVEHQLVTEIWGGPFYHTPLSEVNPSFPAVNLIFVEDKDGNTGSDEPWTLGGGETDFMLYEGLSRLHVDAMIGGAETVVDIALSVWHPEFVEFRTNKLGKKRHPINVITTRKGELDIENQIVFNHPELEVVVLTGDSGKAKLDPKVGHRSWVHIESTGEESDLKKGFEILRKKYGVEYASVIGGRNLATQLIDADLIHDLYLTQTPIVAAEPNTPFYLGDRKALEERLQLVVRKIGQGPEKGVVTSHYKLVPQPGIEPG